MSKDEDKRRDAEDAEKRRKLILVSSSSLCGVCVAASEIISRGK